jgi:hypothetical protein
MRRRLIPTVLVLAAVSLAGLSLAGCSATGAGSSSSSGSADMVTPAIGAPELKVPGGKSVESADASGNRQVIKTGSMTITVAQPADAAEEASRIVESAGGRIDSRRERAATDGDKGSASLTVRIPSAKLTATIEQLNKLGTVEDIAISSDDVTGQSQDLDARITALRTSVDRLLALMAKATSTQDLITIESALSDRQGNLESLEAQQRQLKDQVDLSSVTLNLNSVAKPRTQLPGNFLDGLIAGWNSIVVFFAGVLVVVGVLLPWLVIAGAIAFGVFAVLRARRKRRLASAGPHASTPLEPAAQTQETPPNAS